jgi:predicted amidophosphoribosyltransferase
MPYHYPCKKCGKVTELLSQYCEDCLLKVRRGTLNAAYRERPECRKRIEQLLKDNPNLTLLKIVFWTEYDHPPIIPSDGIKSQARKMLKEEMLKI